MSYNDLIRRGDALAAAKGFIGAETAIAAVPAADPLADPRVQALVEAIRVQSNLIRDVRGSGEHRLAICCDRIDAALAALAEIEGEKK